MRKDDRLRRSELFLPPPSINKHRVIPVTDEKLEEKQVTGFVASVLVAGVVMFLVLIVVYGSGIWFVLDLVRPTQVAGWRTSWVNCVLVAGVIMFCRSWARALRASK